MKKEQRSFHMKLECKHCRRDLFCEDHSFTCPVYQEEAARQTREKCKELGIGGNLELFGIPPPQKTGDP